MIFYFCLLILLSCKISEGRLYLFSSLPYVTHPKQCLHTIHNTQLFNDWMGIYIHIYIYIYVHISTDKLKSRRGCIFKSEERMSTPQTPTQTHTPANKRKKRKKRNATKGTSLGAQWLRIRLPTQGTQVRALVREDPTCRGATKPVRHNYWARVPQLLKPTCLESVLRNKRSHQNKKPRTTGLPWWRSGWESAC